MRKVFRALPKLIIFLILLVLAISFLYPLFYMLVNAFKTLPNYYKDPFGLPSGPLQINNFATMISQFKIFRLFFNTLIISASSVFAILFFGVLASFAFAKYDFKGKSVIYLAIVITLFVPAQVTMIPMYVTFAKMKLVDSYIGVTLAYLAMFLPEAIMLMTANFKGIPDEIMEAAEMDGCGYFRILANVIVPMGRPAIALSVIFYFILTWNDLFTPMVLLQRMDKRTVMVALATLMGRYTGDPPYQFAGLLMSAIPAILVYVVFQKSIVKGMSMGAIK